MKLLDPSLSPNDLTGHGVPDAARERDVATITRLLADAAPETIPLDAEEVLRRLHEFLVLRSEAGHAIAVAAVQNLDSVRCELRSVAVDRAWRGRGIGARLVRAALDRMLEDGREVFCFTFRPQFFARLGFRSVPLSSVPQRPKRPMSLDGRCRNAMSASMSTARGYSA